MDALRLAHLGEKPIDPVAKERAAAEKTAGQFEQLFVRSMVSSLRASAALGGEDGGMFGSGPGADTYADWFDQNLAEQISSSTKVGIASQLLHDLERHHEIPAAVDSAAKAKRLADPSALHAATTPRHGGFDVVL